MAMYLPTSTAGYFVYGNTINENILKTTTDSPITYVVQTLITLHLLFGFVIVINPFCQEIESKFGVPKGIFQTYEHVVLFFPADINPI
jgi:vesicular inhibitory amino acid transporter